MKTLSYLTHDEVNEDEARQTIEACGARMIPLWLRDPLPTGEFHASIFDLDSLPPNKQQDVLDDLLTRARPGRVGIHTFQLDENQASALRQNGVRVVRQLHQDVIRELLA